MTKIFLITGAGSGIGRVVARYLLSGGHRVFLTDYNLEFLEETCTRHLRSVLPEDKHGNFKWAQMDVTNENEVARAISLCVDEFGAIDVLVNNAGINSQYARRGIAMKEVPVSDFQRTIDVNLTGTYRVSQKALPYLENAEGGGVIINMSSCRAIQQSKHGEAYAASKAGISGLSMAMAVSLGPKVRVHVISPGMVDVRFERERNVMPDNKELVEDLQRDFQSEYAPSWGFGKSEALQTKHPVGRVGRGEDIAKWVEFLAVLEGGFTTGGDYLVDGGYSKVLSYPD